MQTGAPSQSLHHLWKVRKNCEIMSKSSSLNAFKEKFSLSWWRLISSLIVAKLWQSKQIYALLKNIRKFDQGQKLLRMLEGNDALWLEKMQLSHNLIIIAEEIRPTEASNVKCVHPPKRKSCWTPQMRFFVSLSFGKVRLNNCPRKVAPSL